MSKAEGIACLTNNQKMHQYDPHRILSRLFRPFDDGNWGFEGLALIGVQLHPHLRSHLQHCFRLPRHWLGYCRWTTNLELLVAETFGIETGSLGLLSVNSKWFVLVRSEQERLVFIIHINEVCICILLPVPWALHDVPILQLQPGKR